MSFWTGVSGVISGIFLIDMAAWLVSGKGLGELVVAGQENPLVLAIVDRLVGIPDWAFWIAVGASIVILSGIMCLAVMSAVVPEHSASHRRMARHMADDSIHGRR